MDMKRKSDQALRLLFGEWQSDRYRTLQFWAFPRTTPERVKRLFRSMSFFGHLRFKVTPRRFTAFFEGKSYSQRYRVMWQSQDRVILAFGKGRKAEIRDIHFDGSDSFYMLAGKANCEFFRRIGAGRSERE